MLHLSGITRVHGEFTVFRHVDLTARPGSACAVVGANGSGKSTLLRCAVGADDVDEGRVLLDGTDLDETDPATRAAIAAVLDDGGMFPHLSVREHLTLIATAHEVDDAEAVVTAILDGLALSAAADQLPVTLSSGQRRRLILASAFVRPRRVLVLDEPEQHLDSSGRAWLARTLTAEKESGVAVLFVSHDRAMVDSVADVVVDADAWR
ncbi:ABC transporter ATP-binding protein [Rhodococcus sp. BP-149]|uniref:ABC transporter ATP-binding protein n=1 Tax=unclassified Rhodococcus (in: high G+C Gram-positive bacteria) TaxID=192944 RepID=UPI001C9BABBC|nr:MULTISPECIES: ABC transporter ATP-binding protein [unclassified Rhodococcus (in: high G+C Gram-positive bacteria)]MBY6684004.1 ABC transporter ATP-binding protein [Rhodococcus sp. BP-288]MBY6693335.1 ABC transporter ATP-binding protein [Rhodococcus sp. BP-188]MBY6697532.1 ABC transporter ATP-binding protein [Rhodococcus sp. BP-285]MBY6702209.1 ABC transporter ATP-binding protein [Rhodococcus sp. BP-283]MBY6706512.1 ABC transporter ATP-binding protein [Rhodococcus sp. BP-241]